MGKRQEGAINKSDIIKFVLVAILILGGFVANYYFSTKTHWSIIVLGWLILVCIAAFIVLQTALGKRFWKFVREARNEMRKVVWPSRRQTFQMTLMVIAIVIIFAIVMWLFDGILLWAVKWLTGQGG